MSSPPNARELADGKLLLDEPAEHVARLTINNPAKRNALDHPILDAIARTVPELEARCLLLTGVGRNVPVEEALVWGLVNAVEPADELPGAGLDLATEIAGNAPLALSGNKTVIRRLLEGRAALPADVERELVELRRACFTSDDFREGVRAFAEKRRPEWRGR